MSTQKTIFSRPHSHRQNADLARQQFAEPLSDHLTFVNALHAYCRQCKAAKTNNWNMDEWCFHHFLNRNVLDEVLCIRRHIQDKMSEILKTKTWDSTLFGHENYFTNIRKALTLSFFTQTAILFDKDHDIYRTVHENNSALLHPDSALLKGGHEWVLYHDFLLTGKPYMQVVTVIDPEWIVVCYSSQLVSTLTNCTLRISIIFKIRAFQKGIIRMCHISHLSRSLSIRHVRS
jgi:pre-mRNA-splicing factor ATP-dependent RNA helicase DHX15/PRP43